jgi:hypothetical protein
MLGNSKNTLILSRLKKKAQVAVHQNQRESLPPKKKAQILETNDTAYQKQQETLPPKKKAKNLKIKTEEKKKNTNSSFLPRRRPKFWRPMLQHTKKLGVPSSQEEDPNFGDQFCSTSKTM